MTTPSEKSKGILCIRVADSIIKPPEHSQIRKCSSCDEDVLVSKGTMDVFGDTLPYICNQCIPPETWDVLAEKAQVLMEAEIARVVTESLPAVEQPDDSTTYRCAQCFQLFNIIPGNEAQAIEDLKREFPGLKPEDCVRICDDCHETLMALNDHPIGQAKP